MQFHKNNIHLLADTVLKSITPTYYTHSARTREHCTGLRTMFIQQMYGATFYKFTSQHASTFKSLNFVSN